MFQPAEVEDVVIEAVDEGEGEEPYKKPQFPALTPRPGIVEHMPFTIAEEAARRQEANASGTSSSAPHDTLEVQLGAVD